MPSSQVLWVLRCHSMRAQFTPQKSSKRTCEPHQRFPKIQLAVDGDVVNEKLARKHAFEGSMPPVDDPVGERNFEKN